MSDVPDVSIGMLLFPRLNALDLTGPYEVFACAPGAKVHLIWKTLDPVISDRGLAMLPTQTFDSCPPLDVICIPGGPGQIDLMDDDSTLAFIRQQSQQARLVTSVCTGSLILGAAGLLQGYKATSHWSSIDQLALLGVEPVSERVVRDGNRITGAGVTSGIDFALHVVAELYGVETAKNIQLGLEYDPEPPFTTGSPHSAPQEQVRMMRDRLAPFIEKRRLATLKAAGRLKG